MNADYEEGFWKSPQQVVLGAIKTVHDHLKSAWSVHPAALGALQKFSSSPGMQALKKPLQERLLKALPLLMDLSQRETILHEKFGEENFFRDLTNPLVARQMIVGKDIQMPQAVVGGPNDERTSDPLLSYYAIKRTETLKELAALMDQIQTF